MVFDTTITHYYHLCFGKMFGYDKFSLNCLVIFFTCTHALILLSFISHSSSFIRWPFRVIIKHSSFFLFYLSIARVQVHCTHGWMNLILETMKLHFYRVFWLFHTTFSNLPREPFHILISMEKKVWILAMNYARTFAAKIWDNFWTIWVPSTFVVFRYFEKKIDSNCDGISRIIFQHVFQNMRFDWKWKKKNNKMFTKYKLFENVCTFFRNLIRMFTLKIH